MIEVRSAGPADAEAISAITAEIQALHAAAHPSVFKPAGVENFAPDAIQVLLSAPDHLFFVATDAGEVVGYLYAEVQRRAENSFRYASTQLYVHQMGVRRERRSGGIGAHLLSAAHSAARVRGISQVALDVWTFNEQACAFYSAQGFEPYQQRLWRSV